MNQKLILVNALLILSSFVFGRDYQATDFPDSIKCKVQPYYKYRIDGKPGRGVVMKFTGSKLYDEAKLEIVAGKIRETIQIPASSSGADSLVILLPPDVGVRQESKVSLTLRHDKDKLMQTIQVPAMRHWTVYVYPHSHVDVGFSTTQGIAEYIHKLDIDQGIKLAEATKDYPEGARYRWNPEVMWPFERYIHSATPEQKDRVIKAVINGQLCLDAAYLNSHTSACSEEELFEFLRHSREIERQTGKPADVLVQVDIHGMAWGLVPVLAHEGVRYVISMPNGGSRLNLDEKPFWWTGPDGKSKIMFYFLPGYASGMGKGRTTGRPWFGQLDKAKIPEVIKTNNPRANFLDSHLFKQLPLLEQEHHPYDIYVISWAMWDNALIDADLPDAVRSWNEDYAYPRLIIAGAHEIMQTFEKQYGDKLPVITGDYTEYWTDGTGSAARETRMNRNAKERLLQVETLWTMLHPGQPAPRADFDEAWRFIMLGQEHTYGIENTKEPFWQESNWRIKKHYFQEAEYRTQLMFEDAIGPATDKTNGALSPEYGPTDGGIALINTLAWPRGGLITLSPQESYAGNRVLDDHGNEVLSQRLASGELVFLSSDVPALASRHYRVVKGNCSLKSDLNLTDRTIDNGLIQVEIDPSNGNIMRLLEKTTGYNFVDPKINGGLNAFRWLSTSGVPRADSSCVISVTESGPLVTELRVTSKAQGCRSLTRSIRLINRQPWIEITNTVDKLPLVAKDAVHFGFGFNIPEATTYADIPWGIIKVGTDRWPLANTLFLTMQHWVDVSNDKAGVTWCSLDAPLFEYGGITAPVERSRNYVYPKVTLSKSTLYSWVMNNRWSTNFPITQDGPVEFRYRIMTHGPYDAIKANRFGVEQSQPLINVNTNSNPIAKPLVEITNDKVTTTILKSTADGKAMILRLRSFSDNDEIVKLSWPVRKPTSVSVCDRGEGPGKTKIKEEVTVPAKGFIVLRAEW